MDIKNPKVIIILATLILGGGSMIGLTVEPEETTALRVDKAVLAERTEHLESQLEELSTRVLMMEDIIDECRRIIE
tara:strand:- start:188 stop:415 length:228 start_codon:yes stop_codon:yes gene_type:complete